MRWPTQQRRRAPRHRVEWDGRYRTDPAGLWVPCVIVDLSLGGVAIELLHDADVPIGRFDVDVRPGPSREGFVLAGEVRNLRRGPRGRQRIGFEFVELTEIQVRVLADLLDVEAY